MSIPRGNFFFYFQLRTGEKDADSVYCSSKMSFAHTTVMRNLQGTELQAVAVLFCLFSFFVCKYADSKACLILIKEQKQPFF